MPDILGSLEDDWEMRQCLELQVIWELERLILSWERWGYMHIDSGTIRDDFGVFLDGLCKTDKNQQALKIVFERCMLIRFSAAFQRWVIKHLPLSITWVLLGEESIVISPGDIFLGSYINQMQQYYHLFLEWQKSQNS